MEFVSPKSNSKTTIKAALFDFDGTFSTLRYGWESIMEPMMLEMISGNTAIGEEIIREVKEYIDSSTGVQTIFQMQWLAGKVKEYNRNPDASSDPWWYKAEYNRRLMIPVEKRKVGILTGEKSAVDYLLRGSIELLEALKSANIDIYVASGSDHPDVGKEAAILGIKQYFKEIAGAPLGKVDCSKEAVLRRLVQEGQLKGNEVLVAGDGKVEIALGREIGAITMGVASDEERLYGINPIKRKRLVKAGADVIVGDFSELDEILIWLGINKL